MRSARSGEILRLLARKEVEFIVVGMAAGVLRGAPVATVDLDIVHRRSPENVARLLHVLAELDAVLEQATEMRLTEGLSVRVLSLTALIEIKERSGRPKDLAVIPVLRATLDELNRKH